MYRCTIAVKNNSANNQCKQMNAQAQISKIICLAYASTVDAPIMYTSPHKILKMLRDAQIPKFQYTQLAIIAGINNPTKIHRKKKFLNKFLKNNNVSC